MAIFDIRSQTETNRLLLEVEGVVSPADLQRITTSLLREARQLRPGFLLVQDTTLARGLGELDPILDELRERGMGRHVSVVLGEEEDLGDPQLSDEVLAERALA